jgi:hypothetical protein
MVLHPLFTARLQQVKDNARATLRAYLMADAALQMVLPALRNRDGKHWSGTAKRSAPGDPVVIRQRGREPVLGVSAMHPRTNQMRA